MLPIWPPKMGRWEAGQSGRSSLALLPGRFPGHLAGNIEGGPYRRQLLDFEPGCHLASRRSVRPRSHEHDVYPIDDVTFEWLEAVTPQRDTETFDRPRRLDFAGLKPGAVHVVHFGGANARSRCHGGTFCEEIANDARTVVDHVR